MSFYQIDPMLEILASRGGLICTRDGLTPARRECLENFTIFRVPCSWKISLQVVLTEMHQEVHPLCASEFGDDCYWHGAQTKRIQHSQVQTEMIDPRHYIDYGFLRIAN